MWRLLILGLLISSTSYGQLPDFWVLLTDKDDSPFSTDSPEEFLSQRAIDRRVTQGIALDQKDIPVDPDYISQIQAISGLEYRFASKWFNAVSVRCDSSILDEIQALPFVSMIKSNTLLKPKELPQLGHPIETMNAQRLPQYGSSANQIMDLNGHVLHESGFEGEGIVIAILDSGFDHVDSIASFEHLFEENRILSVKDFVDGDSEVYEEHFHGRAVLSTIAAIKEDEVYGTAVNASFHLLRTEDVSSETTIEEWNWIAAAEYADSVGADILNTSLGYTGFDTELESYSYEDMDGNTSWITKGSDIAASRGMLVVNSAGNSGSSDWFYIGAPADGDSVLAVGSIDADSSHTSFSSHGPTFDGRVKPNVCAQGKMAFGVNEDDLVVPLNGTSFSSPIIAGLAACLWQAVPEATNMQVFQAIEMSAHLFYQPSDSLGYGIPNFTAALGILEQLTSDLPEFQDSELLIFPNPTSSVLNLVVPGGGDLLNGITVLDYLGREILLEVNQVSDEIYSIDVSKLEQGIYIVKIVDSERALPFIKN